MKRSIWEILGILGPGFAVAATGVGAGDVVTAAVSGAQFGTVVLWAALVGAVLKFALNEGIARWQLATDTTLLEGWGQHLHRFVLLGFAVYLGLWTLIVAGALMAACGLAAHALIPQVSVMGWGILHSLVALGVVLVGRYRAFETLMKVFIALMFLTVLICAVLVKPDLSALTAGLLIPRVPTGSGPFLLGVIGGVGGSVTLLSYSYWIRERNWAGTSFQGQARLDLGAAYGLTGIFGVAIIIIAAGVDAEQVTGNQMALSLAERMGDVAGEGAKWTFLVGFWGAVFTSMLGVWQGVPYLAADLVRIAKKGKGQAAPEVSTRSPYYRGYLFFIAIPPMAFLLIDRPVWIVVIYSVAGALFMPFLAATLLYLNNQHRWVKELKNGWLFNGLLILALVLFAYLASMQLLSRF